MHLCKKQATSARATVQFAIAPEARDAKLRIQKMLAQQVIIQKCKRANEMYKRGLETYRPHGPVLITGLCKKQASIYSK
jgi:hypothetical protein